MWLATGFRSPEAEVSVYYEVKNTAAYRNVLEAIKGNRRLFIGGKAGDYFHPYYTEKTRIPCSKAMVIAFWCPARRRGSVPKLK